MQFYTSDKDPNVATPTVGIENPLSKTTPWSSAQHDEDEEISSSAPHKADDLLHLTDNDVLCGRGSAINKHTGNRRFRRLISANKADYASCEKNSHKNFLALSIVLAIERQGGRFVKRSDERIEDSSLILLSRKDAIAKTAQALRDQLHRGGRGSSNHSPCPRSSSRSPVVAAKKQNKVNQESEALDDDSDVQKIHMESYSDDGSREESSSDYSSNDSSASHHSNDMDCDTGFSAPMFAMMAPWPMFPFTNINSLRPQPSPPSSMMGFYPTSMRPTSSYPGNNAVDARWPSRPLGHETLWIPEELEALVHDDPNVAWALTSL